MTGSNMAPIVIPIVVAFVLAIWLIMVFYADSHPLWRDRRSPDEQRTGAGASRLPSQPQRREARAAEPAAVRGASRDGPGPDRRTSYDAPAPRRQG